MKSHASGTFDVQLVPQGDGDTADGIGLGRLTIAKQFTGGITGTSKGEMLSSRTESAASAAYVALERVTGTIGARSGSFVLLHRGTMDKDGQAMSVTVAANSGTGELSGISGDLQITIRDKQHFYDFEYVMAGD